MPEWMIYGANGYTGELIAREAARRGDKPIIAGRNAAKIQALAAELELPHRVFDAVTADLSGVSLLLNCAGPFSATAKPLIAACLETGAHYLDITGEIEVFEYAHSLDAQARAKNIVLCPGVGFDVIPTDCIARALAEALPDATHLALAFDMDLNMSAGTAKTSVEGLSKGGAIRRNGRIERTPMGFRTRNIDFGQGERTCMALPWGDISTAYQTTRIPNIEVYAAVPPNMLWGARLGNLVAPLLGLAPVQEALKRRAAALPGPSATQRATETAYLWGEARNAAGQVRTARLSTANGYAVTVQGSLAVVGALMGRNESGGSYTPSRLCGWDLVCRLPGSSDIVVS